MRHLDRRSVVGKCHGLQRMEETGVAAASDIVFGKRAFEIVQYTVENDVDLVIMSSRRVDLNDPAKGLAAMSHQVSMLCQCPVLLVK